MPVSSQQIATATKVDSILSRVFDFILNGCPAHVTDTDLQPFFDRRIELTLEQVVILWCMRVVIPEKLRNRSYMKST